MQEGNTTGWAVRRVTSWSERIVSSAFSSWLVLVVRKANVDAVLERVLEAGRDLTGARYAAVGVLDEQRTALERFITLGIDDDTHGAIGDLPRGRGVLGVLITEPQVLRFANVGQHPQSYGFPQGHPPMSSFLGVPISIRGQVYGNLYLTEKRGGTI